MRTTKAKTILATLDAAKAGKAKVTIKTASLNMSFDFEEENYLYLVLNYDKDKHQNGHQENLLFLSQTTTYNVLIHTIRTIQVYFD